MKKQLIGAAAALLLLAGCGGSADQEPKKETKACTFTEEGQELVITVEAEDNLIKTMAIGMDVYIGEELSDEQLETLVKPILLEQLGVGEDDGTEIKLENKDGLVHAEIKMDASVDGAFMQSLGIDADESDMKLDDFIEYMEKDGAVCK